MSQNESPENINPCPLPEVADMEVFQYEPLTDSMDTRLLVLHPGTRDEGIICHLEQVNLDNKPEFEALSYVWGHGMQRVTICCGDRSMATTPNLHSALRQLRHTQNKRVLWADAICINQEDVQERNLQVRAMGNIYASASKTLVWLGDETQETSKAFESLRVARTLFPPDFGIGHAAIPENRAENLVHLINDYQTLQSLTDWHSIVALLKNPWFRRKWIIQEVVKAETTVIMLSGQTIEWEILEEVIFGIRMWAVDNVINEMKSSTEGVIAGSNIVRIGLLKAEKNDIDPTFSKFKDISFNTRGFLSTDNRDQLFAIFGVAKDLPSMDSGLHPDYSLTFAELIGRYVRWCVSVVGSLSFLLCTNPETNSLGEILPSWSPDFTQNDQHWGTTPSLTLFSATRDSTVSASVDPSGTKLRISGKLLDEVKLLAPEFDVNVEKLTRLIREDPSLGDLPSLIIIRTSEWIRECKAITPVDSITKVQLQPEALARSVVWDMYPLLQRAPADFLTLFEKYIEILDVLSQGGNPEEPPESYAVAGTVEETVVRNSHSRRICSTASDRVGSMPANAEVGDKICIFYGGELPYVIRPINSGEYIFVGECYLDGFMDGAAMDLDVESEEFVLV